MTEQKHDDAGGASLSDAELGAWQPIETAPKDGRQLILLKTPYSPGGVPAYSNTWWTCGFSAECRPTHWKPHPEVPNAELRGATDD